MSRRRRLTAKKVVVFNPMPTVTEHEVAVRAGLEDYPEYSEERMAFRCNVLFGTGDEKDPVTLEPGAPREDEEIIDEAPAIELRKAEQHKGFTFIDKEEDRVTATLATLVHARKHYLVNGTQSCADSKRACSAEEWETRKFDYQGQLYNDAKAEILKEAIAELKRPKKKGASSGKNTESVVVT